MALQKFDQLNTISQTWYSKMDIPEKDKKRRVDLSLEFAEIFIIFFELILNEEIEAERYTEWLSERLNAVATNHIGVENIAFINDWSRQEAEHIVEITEKNLSKVTDKPEETKAEPTDETKEDASEKQKTIKFEEFDEEIAEDEYWTSDIRSILVGIECATSVENYREMYDAIEHKYKRKVWMTEADDRVRPTHEEVDRTDIPINELFQVGDSYMLFPGDITHGASAKEIDNCRCRVVYY